MKRVIIFCSMLLIINISFGQPNPTVQKYAATITEADLKENLTIIASDALEGRETGKRGQKMAAAFIASYFDDLKLGAPVAGSHYQPVPLFQTSAPIVTLKAGASEVNPESYVFYGSGHTNGEISLPLVFAGKGSDADLAKLDIKGKAVLIFLDGSTSLRNNPIIAKLRDKGVGQLIVAIEKNEDFTRMSGLIKRFSGGGLSLENPQGEEATGSFVVSPEMAGKFFNTTNDKLTKAIASKQVSKIKPASIQYSIKQSIASVMSENILGYLEGTDKKDEVVVVTAHYDHVGISQHAEGDKINNGADDDGSGTVAVLAIAKAFAQAKKEGNGPRRSILFMTVTGEEKGLLGSEYYSEHPVYPLDKTVVDLNIDMIGRRDPQHKDSAPYVYVIGSDRLSSELHTASEKTNNTYTHLIFDYLYNAEDHPDKIYYRSDHWNFAKKNIPIVFYFDGIHEDYHKPSDEVDKIEFDLLALRAKNVFHLAWEIANRDTRLVVDKK